MLNRTIWTAAFLVLTSVIGVFAATMSAKAQSTTSPQPVLPDPYYLNQTEFMGLADNRPLIRQVKGFPITAVFSRNGRVKLSTIFMGVEGDWWFRQDGQLCMHDDRRVLGNTQCDFIRLSLNNRGYVRGFLLTNGDEWRFK